MNITMNNKISEYNANIGHEFDKQSAELKAKNLRYTKAYIGFLASGAVFADLGGLIDSKISFTIAFMSTALSFWFYRQKQMKNFTEQWTYTRVIAETFKSEWFKFVVGGGDYPKKLDEEESLVKEEFKKKLREFFDEYKESMHHLKADYIKDVDMSLDEKSLEIRTWDLEKRLEYYQKNRMEDQKNWYEQRSTEMGKLHDKYNSLFKWAVGIGTGVGALMLLDIFSSQFLIPGLLKENDFFSILIAAGFTFDALNSALQYERLNIAYKKSFNELSDAIREMDDDNNDVKFKEKVFNEFVEDIENKISSEHKSWSLTTSTKNIH